MITRIKFFRPKNAIYPQDQNFWEYEVHRVKGKTMRILIMTAITAMALPFMAVGQTSQTSEEPQQTQGQTKDTHTTAPAKGKKMRAGQEQTQSQAKPETGTNVQGQSNIKGRAEEINKNQATR